MTSRIVHFYSDGYKLEADYMVPDNTRLGAKLPGVALCGGWGGIRSVTLPEIAQRLIAAGYAVCAFDYRGFGGSEGPEARIDAVDQCEDIRSALTWLSLQDEVDPARLGLWGTSGGGARVVYVAAIDERVKCTVGQVGYGDGYRLIMDHKSPDEQASIKSAIQADRDQRVASGKSGPMRILDILSTSSTKQFVQGDLGFDPLTTVDSAEAELEHKPLEVVHRIAPRALLLMAADNDDLCSPAAYKEVYDRAGEPKRWVTFPIGHYDIYGPPWVDRAADEAIAWYDAHL